MLLGLKDILQGGTSKSLHGCISLVGHVTPIEVTSFSPRVYQKADSKNALIAVGSQDGTVSVWTNSSPRPLVVLDGFFEHTVLDLAWTPDGRKLAAVSYDGHVALIRFQRELVGESVVAMHAKPKAVAERTVPAARLEDLLLPKPPPATTAQVVQMRDGKRRITPQLLQSPSSQLTAAPQSYLDSVQERVKPILEIQSNYQRTRGKARRLQIAPIVFMQDGSRAAEVVDKNTLTVRARHGRFAWKERFSHPIDSVLLSAADSNCLFVACGNRLSVCSVHTGRRLLPPITLDSPIVAMHGNLVVVTEDAVLYVWSAITKSPLIFPIPLLTDDTLLRIECGQTIELHFKQHTLSHIGGNWYEDSRLVSEYSPPYSISGNDTPDARMEEDMMHSPLESLEHVECELARALLTNLVANASIWLKTYVKRCMADQSLVPRLRELSHSFSSTPLVESQEEAELFLLNRMLEWAREVDERHPFCAELEAVISSSL